MKKSVIAIAFCSMMSSSVFAAATDIQTQTADVTFTVPAILHFDLFGTSLVAGNHTAGRVVGHGQITASGADNVAFRWTPGVGESAPGMGVDHRVIAGNSSSGNTLGLVIQHDDIVVEDDWLVPSTPTTDTSFSVALSEDQTVPADTYTISIDAAIWEV